MNESSLLSPEQGVSNRSLRTSALRYTFFSGCQRDLVRFSQLITGIIFPSFQPLKPLYLHILNMFILVLCMEYLVASRQSSLDFPPFAPLYFMIIVDVMYTYR